MWLIQFGEFVCVGCLVVIWKWIFIGCLRLFLVLFQFRVYDVGYVGEPSLCGGLMLFGYEVVIWFSLCFDFWDYCCI